MTPAAEYVRAELHRNGFARVHRLSLSTYAELAGELGKVVGQERIALRPGAHAYVAKPGRVPFHTDHPDVDVITWYCEEQDADDGASLLVDLTPILQTMEPGLRTLLQRVELECPPLAGGPPAERRPVIRPRGERFDVFCSPWLRSAWPVAEHERAIENFRQLVSAHAKADVIRIRLEVGDALLVDNRRVLHGRDAIAAGSRRTLHRMWIQE